MRRITKCFLAALLLLAVLTTCVFAQYPADTTGAATLYIGIDIPPGDAALEQMLRQWVEQHYFPMLAHGGVLAGIARGEMQLNFAWELAGEYFTGISLQGELILSRDGRPDSVLRLAESLNVNTATHTFIPTWEILDFDEIEPVLALLHDAILAEAPSAQPYLDEIDPRWLSNLILGAEGILVPLDGRRFLPEHIGEMTVLLPYEKLNGAFLLAGSTDFPLFPEPAPPEAVPLDIPPPLWPHALHPYLLDYVLPALDYDIQPVDRVHRPMIALTFDDGPSRITEMILDTFALHGGRATFAVIGNRIADGESTVIRAFDMGHEIIGHSWRHTDMTTQSRAEVSAAITRTEDAIYALTGTRSNLFRPPFGAINAQVESVAAELGYGILLWTIDPKDWRYHCADHIYSVIMNHAKDGSVVVLHDIFPTTAQAMTRVVPRLIARGFDLVTVSELLAHHYGEIEPGATYRGVRNR
ncbi:MAG: polysaccharide deacetylase family protein [Defluviitaleaceae bacterium]|nr:polysaccharide deacetylase family protein [Defluviitaleaceae bacterium]MCL2239539.1 polysaccharide deacetylase family protein [Defluviitaleaceae bacterium]